MPIISYLYLFNLIDIIYKMDFIIPVLKKKIKVSTKASDLFEGRQYKGEHSTMILVLSILTSDLQNTITFSQYLPLLNS